MKNYRELTGDDVLQAGDRMRRDSNCCRFHRIPDRLIGRRVNSIIDGEYTFRRKLTPAEITAAERVRFEVHYHGLDFSRINKGIRKGDYVSDSAHIRWNSWCAAVGCDPMGDV